ncbi:MAG: ATP-binding protein [Melioribacteraceae bacterium]
MKNKETGWGETTKELTFKLAQKIQDAFDHKTNELLSVSKKIKSDLAKLSLEKVSLRTQIFNMILVDEFSNYSIQINDSTNKLLAWNSNPAVQSNQFIKLENELGQTFIVQYKLKRFLSIIERVSLRNDELFLAVSIPISQVTLPSLVNSSNQYLLDSLQQELSTEINLLDESEVHSKVDGRNYSTPILNNYKNRIGIITFPKPALDLQIVELKENVNSIQSILILLFAFILSFEFGTFSIKQRSRLMRFLFIALLVLSNRVLLFLLNIPSSWIINSLSDPSNFSSRFAIGMVRSPLEFFLTAISFAVIAFYGYRLIVDYSKINNSQKKNIALEIIAILMLLFAYLLLWRGFGASIRSVIFDSTIRYFKEFSLIPSPAVFLMCVNILILGFTIFMSAIALLLIMHTFLKRRIQFVDWKYFSLIFVTIQVMGFVFDRFQTQPQGTDLIRVFFFTFSILILIVIIKSTKEIVYKYFLYSLASSIISVSLLTYYNSQLERESLKNTAYDLVRVNEGQIQFMLYQTLMESKQNPIIENVFKKGEDFSVAAFSVWMKSLFYREGINATVSFYDENKNQLGKFSSADGRDSEDYASILDPNQEIKIVPLQAAYSYDKKIIGALKINDGNYHRGYLVVTAIPNSQRFSHELIPKILIPERVGILSAVDYDKLNIYEFSGNNLIRSSRGEILNQENSRILFSAPYNENKEAWLELDINGEKNLLFAIKSNYSGEEHLLAVARENKNLTWNLSDFFKIFFIHTIVILIISIFVWLFSFKKQKLAITSFRAKLVTGFLFISVVPLFLIAVYIRNITEEKNREALSNLMLENVDRIINCIEPYLVDSSVDQNLIFAKASRDLNTKFSIYTEKGEIFSSSPSLYSAGLFGGQINHEPYLKYLAEKEFHFFGKEAVLGNKINSAYGVLNSADKIIFVEVNDLLNKYQLPLSELELDVFLFGIFSFAIIVIIVMSTILSGQISLPIKRLTLATRAVSNGDLSVSVPTNNKGEIGELANGFNLMIEKIRQNQIDIAQFEREEAWREMAKQVAHEIKNPLTPMKLSVQQLMAAYNDKSPKFDSIFEKVTATIISQIDTLKNIASEFSNFARMPRANLVRLNIIPLLSEVINLYAEQKRSLELIASSNEIFVIADNDHLKRTFVNLIRNAFQADADKVIVSFDLYDGRCSIRFADNGKGIDEKILPKIFDENYTTKKYGMGLGLNMAKKYIESINGKIEVEKTSGSGTTFLITIPLVNE